MIIWVRPIAECFKAYIYNIIDENYHEYQDGVQIHKVQIRCNKSELKGAFRFYFDLKKGYWRFHNVSSLGIW